ncbi:MAG TPA: tetraacyldisaccharide 4'-kinase, partial [Candidatus Goldiibacteriota bacterium]|nr:tetraacyldisaccharide 4'-kinase [Candidatus Goldiibacteriota bacterium]
MGIDNFWQKSISGKNRGILELLFFVFLLFLSLFYLAGLGIKNLADGLGLFKKKQYGKRLISVGNITVGGTGKT